MNEPTRSGTRRPLEADKTLAANDQSGLENEEESKPRTDEDQSQAKRKKLNPEKNVKKTTIDTLDNVGENIEMNPIVSNGNVLSWKFENIYQLTEDGMSSDKFTINNIDWSIHIQTTIENGVKYLSIFLDYDNENEKEKNWICETDTAYKLVNHNENGKDWTKTDAAVYGNFSITEGFSRFIKWSNLESYGFKKRNSIVVEIDFDFKYYDFSKNIPNYTDITINLKGTMFYVNKGMLCSHSKYFFNLFMNENNQATSIEIDDIEDWMFVHLIASFYPSFQPPHLNGHEQLMRSADKYGCATLHSICETFLISCNGINLVDKFEYAEQYNYRRLMSFCLSSLTSAQDIKRLRKCAGFNSLKESTKLSIMNRLLYYS